MRKRFIFSLIACLLLISFLLTACDSKTYLNAEYGFSIKHPSFWIASEEAAGLFTAVHPDEIPGLSVYVVEVAEAATLADVITLALGEAAEILSESESTLADGTPVSMTEEKWTYQEWPMHSLSLGVIKDDMWVVVTVWTIDQYVPYDEAEYSKIAHTLTFK